MFDEKSYLRDLAKETYEYATSDIMNARRVTWTLHNDLKSNGKPLIYIRYIPFHEIFPIKNLKCTQPNLRQLEKEFLLNRYRMTLPDDYIIEPYITLDATINISNHSIWGIPCNMTHRKTYGEAQGYTPSILELEDAEKMVVTDYSVNEQATLEKYEQLYDILKDSIPIVISRKTPFADPWNADISTLLAKMRGLEQLMWDMYDNPEWLHKIISFMQKAILCQLDLTEQNKGYSSIDTINQAMPYSDELVKPNVIQPVNSMKDLWIFMASQEFTGVGPDMFKEFMFDYQKPIIERFGLASYGCCEDMTQKIGIVKELKNLRRIAITPFSNARKCAEQIGKNYVTSWRPNPSSAVATGVNEDFVRKDLQEHFKIFKENNCNFDITLKDAHTMGPDNQGIFKWTTIVREEIEKNY
ncbi:hypothetical protein AN641_01230 [Candidatus Epulonipiscioides gigas]|nr:hypothetical protein AN641_01230 [Epulopiscium sp. SCG-C07WGA-EpuloA2]